MALKDSLSIMVVDDMATSRGLIIMALEEMGIKKIDFRKDGADALQSLVAKPVHLVISDYNMPGMDGLGLLSPCARTASPRASDSSWSAVGSPPKS
jgi:two-component system chemotaxis response regulator CheY